MQKINISCEQIGTALILLDSLGKVASIRDEGGIHTCAKCHTPKPCEEFPPVKRNKAGAVTRRFAYCYPCHIQDAYERKLLTRFLLTLEDYAKIAAETNNCCAICGRPPLPLTERNKRGRRLALDHRHKDGLVRGLLCNHCNRNIAKFREDPVLLRKAADYLENPPASRALGRDHFGLPGRVGTKKQRKLSKVVLGIATLGSSQ